MKNLILACCLLSLSVAEDSNSEITELPNPEDHVQSQSWYPIAEDFLSASKERMEHVERLCDKNFDVIKRRSRLSVGKKRDVLKIAEKKINNIKRQIHHMKDFIGYVQSALYQSPYSNKILANPNELNKEKQKFLDKQAFIELQKSTANSQFENLEKMCAAFKRS